MSEKHGKANSKMHSRKKSFRERKTIEQRIEESKSIKSRYIDKIPVIIERAPREKNLPFMDKTKFLIPMDLTMSQLMGVIRQRLKLKQTQTLYLVVNTKTLVTMTCTVAELYQVEKDKDGFLYFHYASQDVFGGLESRTHQCFLQTFPCKTMYIKQISS